MTVARLWTLTVLIIALLAASLAFAVLRLSWHWSGHTSVVPLEIVAQPQPDTVALQRDIGAIAAFSPFGQPATAVPEQSRMADAAPLDVVLRGVLVDPDPALSRAFIQAAGATTVFRVGGNVLAAELVAINVDTVTLRAGDGLVIVGFDGVRGAQAPVQREAEQDPTVTDPGDPFARLAAAIVPGRGSIDLRDTPPPETTEEYINLWRDRIIRDPQSAMDSVGVEVVENGYRVKADPNIGVTIAGLKTGDVVTRLNGQTVGDLEQDKKLYDEVAASGVARLEVVRDGRAMLLTFPLR
jgi:general secretion pathway protein C